MSSSPAPAPAPHDEGFDFDSDKSTTHLPRNETQKQNPLATMQTNTATTSTPPSKRKRSADIGAEIPGAPLSSHLGETYSCDYNYNREREREILIGRFGNMKLDVPEGNRTGMGEGMGESVVVFDGGDEARDMEMDDAGEESEPTIKRRRERGEKNPTVNVVPPEDGDGDLTVQMPSPPREASDVRGQRMERSNSKRLRSPPPPIEPPSPEAEEETLSDVDQHGIVYIPTPAQRFARSQKRLQQVSFVFPWLGLESPTDVSVDQGIQVPRIQRGQGKEDCREKAEEESVSC